MSIPGLLDAIGIFAVEELVISIVSFFSLQILHPLRHRFRAAHQAGILGAARRAEMADEEQTKKIVPLVTCDITFCQNVCELMVPMCRI